MSAFKYFLIFISFSLVASEKPCPFCNQEIIEKQFVHETKKVITLYCLTPATKGNLLVIPKRHVERFEDLTKKELYEVQKEIALFAEIFSKFYGASDYVILQKNGKMAGQSVPHLHFHLIPANKPAEEIFYTAFHYREKLTDEEMKICTKELQDFLKQ